MRVDDFAPHDSVFLGVWQVHFGLVNVRDALAEVVARAASVPYALDFENRLVRVEQAVPDERGLRVEPRAS